MRKRPAATHAAITAITAITQHPAPITHHSHQINAQPLELARPCPEWRGFFLVGGDTDRGCVVCGITWITPI